jgi:quinol monooxygenase YgiN
MLAVVAHYRTAPAAGDFVAPVLARHAAASRAEPGCLPSEASTSIDDPGRFVLYEACTSKDGWGDGAAPPGRPAQAGLG